MVHARVSWTSEVVRSWYPEADLRVQLRSALAVEADRTEDATFGREYRDDVALDASTDPLDWANRRIELPGGGWAITGIRFRGLDVERPFVDLVATTTPPTTDGLAVVAAAVESAYRAFAPLCLRVDAPEPATMVEQLDADPRFGPHCAVDMHLVAGLVSRLRAHPRADTFSRVTLRSGDPEQLAQRVAAIYQALTERDPRLAMWATPEDGESLLECAEAGLLFDVLCDGEPAGVVAACRNDAHAMSGFSVEELCLDVSHHGQRLAPAATQRLIEQLPASERDVLWGTIHPANAPSLRSALSIGRQHVGGYVWVTPDGCSGMPPGPTG
jgi:hypothetical protein